jgi:hypothetical protein
VRGVAHPHGMRPKRTVMDDLRPRGQRGTGTHCRSVRPRQPRRRDLSRQAQRPAFPLAAAVGSAVCSPNGNCGGPRPFCQGRMPQRHAAKVSGS